MTEIKREIDDRLTPGASEYWNGLCESEINEVVIEAQRHGIVSAVQLVESLAE